MDDLIGALVSQHRDLPSLLTTIFGWLHRYSDLYIVDDSPKRPVGFPTGDAEKILLKAFKAFPYKPPAAPAKRAPTKSGPAAPPTVQAEEGKQSAAVVAEEPAAPVVEGGAEGSSASITASTNINSTSAATPPPVSVPSLVKYTAEGKQIPVASGGVGPGYWWEQTLTTVSLYVQLPLGVSGKSVECSVTGGRRLRLALKGSTTPIIDAPLYGNTGPEVVWNVDTTPTSASAPFQRVDREKGAHLPPPGCGLVVVEEGGGGAGEGGSGGGGGGAAPPPKGRLFSWFADKVVHTWWRSLVVGGPEIDAQMVDSTQPISAYDEETQVSHQP